MTIKVGLIGSGWASYLHARCLKENPDVEIVSLADVDKASGTSLAKRYNIPKFYEEPRKLLEDSEIEAVYINSPPNLHASQAIESLKCGKHVFSEKPPAISLKKARMLVETVEKTGLIYQLGCNRRFWFVYKKLKEMVISGRLKPFVMDIKMVRGEMEKPSWTKVREIAGGFLFDSVMHVLDLSRWILGEPETVRCLARRNIYPHPDGFAIIMEFSNEERTIASITSAGHASWVFPFERIEIYGDHCTAITEEKSRLIFASGKLDVPKIEVYQPGGYHIHEHVSFGFKEEDDLFIEAVSKGLKPPVTVEDAYKNVELAEACYSSADQNGNPIRIGC